MNALELAAEFNIDTYAAYLLRRKNGMSHARRRDAGRARLRAILPSGAIV